MQCSYLPTTKKLFFHKADKAIDFLSQMQKSIRLFLFVVLMQFLELNFMNTVVFSICLINYAAISYVHQFSPTVQTFRICPPLTQY